MQIQFTGHNMDITPALRELTITKLERLKRRFDQISSIHVTFLVDKLRQQAKATLRVGGTQIIASSESEDMYKTVDALIERLCRRIQKRKEKDTEHR